MTMVRPRPEELREQFPELAPRHGIDARRRLVEQQDLRLVHEGARQRQFLLHPARQAIGAARAETRQLRHVEQAVARGPIMANAVDLGEECDVLVDAQIAVQGEALRQVANLRGDGAMVWTGSCPKIATVPALEVRSPAATRIVVVLPAPSGPISPNISPGLTSNERSLIAVTAP